MNSEKNTRFRSTVNFYRERYGSVGLFENEVYPGIVDSLRHLTSRGA